jgi:hypothetical protein
MMHTTAHAFFGFGFSTHILVGRIWVVGEGREKGRNTRVRTVTERACGEDGILGGHLGMLYERWDMFWAPSKRY